MWINGVVGGAVLALGSLCGALVPGDWDRCITYAAAGVMNSLAAFVLMAANRPFVYLAGTAFYLATAGFCWARFTALMAEIVGSEARDASTLYSVLNAVGSLPIMYMIWLDGVGFQHFGTRGLLWTDASGNLVVFIAVTAIFVVYGLGLRSAVTPQVSKPVV